MVEDINKDAQKVFGERKGEQRAKKGGKNTPIREGRGLRKFNMRPATAIRIQFEIHVEKTLKDFTWRLKRKHGFCPWGMKKFVG